MADPLLLSPALPFLRFLALPYKPWVGDALAHTPAASSGRAGCGVAAPFHLLPWLERVRHAMGWPCYSAYSRSRLYQSWLRAGCASASTPMAGHLFWSQTFPRVLIRISLV